MNITIESTKKNTALFAKMADEEDYQGAMKARQAFAAFIRDPLLDVIEAWPYLQRLYTTYTFQEGQANTIPMDQFFDIKDAGFYRVWSQARPGSLASSRNEDVSELPVSTYTVDSAINFSLNYLRAARVDAIAAGLEHSAQNFLRKTETNSAVVLSNMAAQTTYKLRGTDTRQVYRTLNQGTVLPQDISALERIMTRVNTANIGGTPLGASRSIDALVASPEFGEQVRNMAFEPLNNTLRATYPLAGPDAMRQAIYESPNPSIYGMELMILNDLGTNQAYNILFSKAATGITYAGYNGGSAAAFAPGSEQVVFAVNRKVKSLGRLVKRGGNSNSTMKVLADNQFSNREEKVGFWMKMEEGRVGLDGRGVVTLVW